MSTHSTSSYSISLILHAAFVAAVLFTAYAFKNETARKTTEVFELVAGAGDNWAATEATALGTPDAVKFEPAATPRPREAPVAAPKPEPVVAAPVEPSPVVAPPEKSVVAPPKVEPKKTAPEKTLAEQFQQAVNRKENALMAKHRRAEAARAKREAAEEAKRKAAEAAKKKTTSYEDFQKSNPQKVASNNKSSSSKFEPISTKGLATGVPGGKTDKAGAGGTSLSRAEQDMLGTYFAFLKQKVKDAHVMPLGVTNQATARVSFHVSASGTISQVKIVRSSGSTEFDQSVIAAFRAVGAIGPRPDGRGDTHFTDFSTKDGE